MRTNCLDLCMWLCLLGTSVALREHYCERNVTTSSLVPVTKQRTVIKQPSKWKLWKKAQRITEFYNTHEEQITYKLISECCPGYMQVESGLCEPICERGCPAHASCVAPQRCQCTAGYVSAVAHRDGSHYCEPICERTCPTGSQCVAPNTCACKPGYQSLPPTGDGVSAPCAPVCQLGDGCANGQCVDVERCVCNRGYQWNVDRHSCEQQSEEEMLLLSNDDVTELEEYLSSGTATTSAIAAVSAAADCAEGFVFYAGECRAEFFESNESVVKDCRQTGCGAHQNCNDQGNCSCNAGYVKEQQQGNATANATLTCRRGLLEQLLSIDQAADDEDELNTLTIPIVGVATGALLVLLIVGLIGGLRRRRGHESNESVEPKEPVLQCEFTQKSYDVDEWVP
ncbi:epidermal growth factor-like protein 6 [Drosophila novamexicana]|uniref:epidermal growth factor-like protein 6 n=1 Tax=Drosophila novamexicana TaxID=47314 RepID=UPI0011E5C54B|nr:epidermal growth factor-like protein 6 [Drosophila novamexicana]